MRARLLASLRIPGQPVAKGRPRIVRRPGGPVALTPVKTERYESLVAMMGAASGLGRIEGVPLIADITAVFDRPKRLKGSERVRHDKRPDLDNCIKCLDGLSAHFDDGAIVEIRARKFYAAAGEEPHAVINILAIEEE